MASTKLTRTFSSTGNRKIFTTSFWMKRSKLGGQQPLFSSDLDNTNNSYTMFYLDGGDGIGFYNIDGGSSNIDYLTNRKLRDTNSWYHIVIVFDSTQSGGNRIKFYINGVRETSFANSTEPNQDADNTWFNRTYEHMIGTRSYDSSTYFDGSMSHFHFIDGTAYDASYFGSTDSTTGEWKINTGPSVTYGTNGFFILKDGNTITDSSPNSNNFSLGGGTLTKTEDCPSNVFATLNPLINFSSSYSVSLSKGNTTLGTSVGSTDSNATPATLGMVTGKYYWETKFEVDLGSGTAYPLTGIMAQNPSVGGNYLGGYNDSYGYAGWNGTVYNNGGSTGNTGGGATYTAGDILSMAYDADNNRLYYYKNGAIQNSGTGIVIPAASTTALGAWFPAVGDWGDSRHVWSCNFGNGNFDGTAITTNSGNGYAGAEGASKFNYQPPTGYSALNTKGLNL